MKNEIRMGMVSAIKEASWGRRLLWLALVLVGLLILIQLVPYGRDHANPPVQAQAKIANPEVQKLWDKSCADCHSNLTTWPWYSNVAPMSWLVQNHVDEGRTKMNLSEWQTMPQPDIGEVRGQIDSGEMPPWNYSLIHGGLSAQDKKVLIAGLTATYRRDPPGSISRGD